MSTKREYQSSELIKILTKKLGFEEKIISFQIKNFLKDYLDEELFQEIEKVDLKNKTLMIKIKSPLLRNDFRLRKLFYLSKIHNLGMKKYIDTIEIL